ncbi:NIL domain-containing protein [Candidatus Oleimmundimicrobium sp.]|uniref:NIL domain-containing protein n=1 Tax=Candidatus Oleimmundimicrobium sp. TaxID=3060597 RepID=UPI00271B15E2|nr:NIL domain-containing protein [Candidatus Oleimmundimicrobium sp.]MDO8886496.1 4Fe-4S binding protein [Candidatus Oleimmundimicrobium sp.]
MAKKKIVLTFPPERVEQPITYHLVKDYDLIINIMRAEVHEEETGLIVLELEGPENKIDEGIAYLKNQDVGVQEAARDIALNEDDCISCGACTAVCRPRALHLNPDTFELEFDKDRCILCGLCVRACPLKLIEVKF